MRQNRFSYRNDVFQPTVMGERTFDVLFHDRYQFHVQFNSYSKILDIALMMENVFSTGLYIVKSLRHVVILKFYLKFGIKLNKSLFTDANWISEYPTNHHWTMKSKLHKLYPFHLRFFCYGIFYKNTILFKYYFFDVIFQFED